MEYFGKAPSGPGTGVADSATNGCALARAYPNPFNPSTTISYIVAAPGHVRLFVCDAAGRVVAPLVDGHEDPGDHAIVWDGRTSTGERVASGVYFIRMETEDGFAATRKMVLLK
jgi:hypothetical protein